MSETVHYDYGTSLCPVQENRKLIIEDCDPESITDELRAANFVREGSRFVKRRPRLRTRTERNKESDGLQVLSVRVVEDVLHVKPSDVVGIVRLVPGMSVQIEPKIDWEHVIEMLLTIYDIDRTQSYYGIPLDDLLSSGIESAQIIAILAINYVHGVRTIRRKGFIRNLHIRRRTGFEGLGSVDVEQTLVNHATGNLAPTWVETQIEYANSVNAAIHRAGKLLLRLLQQDRNGHPRQDVLLSLVHQEVERMEELGVQSSQKRLGEYRRLYFHDIPRQRQYYRRAFHTAQSILSATLLGQVGGGPEELLVDYALRMDALFEDYSHRVLTRTVNSLDDIDYLGQLSDVTCQHEKRLYPYAHNTSAHHKPDHLLCDDGKPIAVLDSKYYRKGRNPAIETEPRSQMFAYAYLTKTDRMAFLCPHLDQDRLPVQYTGGEVQIVSPDGDFTCDEYNEIVREYVLETLGLSYPELRVFETVTDGHLCLNDASEDDLSQIHDTNGPFSIRNPTKFADSIIIELVFSSYGPNKPELDDHGRWTRTRIKEACERTDERNHPKYPQHETTCVPIYDPEGNDDHGTITLYFLRSNEGSISVSTEGPLALM
jgi:hypothetical protein